MPHTHIGEEHLRSEDGKCKGPEARWFGLTSKMRRLESSELHKT